MTEKRHASRQKSFGRGFVYFGNNPSTVDCTVRDISDTDVQLTFSGSALTTDTLSLNIPVKGQTFHAKVKWQEADEIGIAFIDVSAAGSEHTSDAELSVWVEKLEAEIAALKQLIKRLQKNSGNKTEVA